MSVARPKPSSQFVEYLRSYLDPNVVKSVHENKHLVKAEHDRKAKEQDDEYESRKKIYPRLMEHYESKYAVYLEALKKYNPNSLLPEPKPPLKPEKPVPPPFIDSSDPRLKSLDEVRHAENQPGLLGRVFNRFPFEYEKHQAIDSKKLGRYIDVLNNIVKSATFSEGVNEKKREVTVVDDQSKRKLHEFIGDCIFLSCEEILDETGYIHPDVMELLGLDKIHEKWIDDKKSALLSQTLPQILFSYYSQFLIGGYVELGKDKRNEADNSSVAKITTLLQDPLYNPDTLVQTDFYREKIESFRFFQAFTVDIKKLPLPQLEKIIRDDVNADFINAFQKLVVEMRKDFWINITKYLSRTDSDENKNIIQVILKVVHEQDAKRELGIVGMNKSLLLSPWLRVRDNNALLDNLIKFTQANENKLTKKVEDIVRIVKMNEELICQPIDKILTEIQKTGDTDFNELIERYRQEVYSIIFEHSIDNDAKAEINPFVIGASLWRSLPNMESVRQQTNVKSVFPDDKNGEIQKQLRVKYEEWVKKNLTSRTTLYADIRHKDQIYVKVKNTDLSEAKPVHFVKNKLLADLQITINTALTNPNPESLEKTIDDWKNKAVTIFEDKEGTKPYKSNYDVLSIRTGIKLFKTTPESQSLVDDIIKLLQAAKKAPLAKPK